MSYTRIYQFSDIPLLIKNQIVVNDYGVSWAGNINNYLYTHKKYSSYNKYNTDVLELSFNGVLLNDGINKAYQIEQKLKALVGVPDNLICYLLPNNYPAYLDECLCESDCDVKIKWINAPAILSNVEVTTDTEDYQSISISLQFKLLDYFAPLDNLVYKFDGVVSQIETEEAVVNTTQEARDLTNCFPTIEELFNADCVGCNFFSKKLYSDFFKNYETKFWGLDNCCCDSDIIGLDFIDINKGFYTEEINIDSSIWGAPPSSIYAFKVRDIPTDDIEITLTVKYLLGNNTKTEITRFTIGQLNQDINPVDFPNFDYKPNDILYFGDINFYSDVHNEIFRPAFFYRYNAFSDNYNVDDGHPLIRFPSYAPGQIYASRNVISLTAKGDSGLYKNLQFAYKHIPRRV